jgi:hypothetical protein
MRAIGRPTAHRDLKPRSRRRLACFRKQQLNRQSNARRSRQTGARAPIDRRAAAVRRLPIAFRASVAESESQDCRERSSVNRSRLDAPGVWTLDDRVPDERYRRSEPRLGRATYIVCLHAENVSYCDS